VWPVDRKLAADNERSTVLRSSTNFHAEECAGASLTCGVQLSLLLFINFYVVSDP
jgi:hypothetical protein